jgi:hypothetical protein
VIDLSNLVNIFKSPYKLEKVAEIPNTEAGAEVFLRYMAGLVRNFWASDERMLWIAQNWHINYFVKWLDGVFVYQSDLRIQYKGWTLLEAETIKKPSTMMKDYDKTKHLYGDCKDAAIFTACILKNYESIGLIPSNEVYLLQIINYGTEEKHVAAAYRRDITSSVISVIDPTTRLQINPERIRIILQVNTNKNMEI